MIHCWRCPRGRWSNDLKFPTWSQCWRSRPHTDCSIFHRRGYQLWNGLNNILHWKKPLICSHANTSKHSEGNWETRLLVVISAGKKLRYTGLMLFFTDLSPDTMHLCMYRCIHLWMPPMRLFEHTSVQRLAASLVIVLPNVNVRGQMQPQPNKI